MINLNTANILKLPPHLKKIVDSNTPEDLVTLCKVLQGGIISYSMTTKQKDLASRLRKHITDLEEINSVFDYVSHERKMYIDSKSPSYDNNTPAEFTAAKYIRDNLEGYDMYFVVTGSGDIKWPIKKYKDLGITIVTEEDFMEIING